MALRQAAAIAFVAFMAGIAAEAPRFDAGMKLYKAGKLAQALEEFDASEKSGEPQAERSFYQGVCLAKEGNWSSAAMYLGHYTESRPADARGWRWLAQSRLYARQFDRARAAIQRAIELEPNSAEAHRTLGEIELELKNHDAAYRAWIQANRLDPLDARTTYYIGRLFFEADFMDEAAVWLRKSLQAAPHEYAAMTYLGMCAERLEMRQTAIDLYVAAIRESKNQKKPYSWAFLSYGKLLRETGQEQEALAVLEEAEKICPEAHALTALGQMLAWSQPARAEAVLRRAIEMDPSIPDAHYRMALLLRADGQASDAAAEMRKFQEWKAAAERNKVSVQAIRRDP